MHFYELKKLPTTVDESNPMQRWLALFKAESTEELEAVEKMGDGKMKEAVAKLRKLAKDEKYRRLEDMREEAAHEYASKLGGAYRRGEAAGRAAGRAAGEAVGRAAGEAVGRAAGEAVGRAAGEAERAFTTARLMKADGLDIKTIAKYTGLEPHEVVEL